MRKGTETYPKISIVTPSYNQAAYLEITMRSVLDQGYDNLEYIVIDGGSTDGSLEIIRRYSDRLAYWENEPDRGPGHALNKGFSRATGDIFAWVNSDDYLLPGALHTVARVLTTESVNMVYGDNLHVDQHGCVTGVGILPAMPLKAISLYALGCIHQESAFWTADLHRKTGLLSETIFPGFDVDWFLRMSAVPECRPKYLRVPLGAAREHPAQNIAQLREEGDNEAKLTAQLPRKKFIQEHGTPRWKLVLGGLYYGLWRRAHYAYVNQQGWRYLFHLPKLNTLRRLANVRQLGDNRVPQAMELSMHPATCPVCRGEHAERLFDDRNRRENLPIRSGYVTCVECGMIYLSPAPDWRQLSKYYDWLYSIQQEEVQDSRKFFSGDGRGWLAGASKPIRALRLRPHSWPTGDGYRRSLLELGCGDAVKLIEFAERGWKVVGLDISVNALEQARRNVPSGEFYLGELSQLDFSEQSFHVVRADNVLEHVPNPSELVTQCRRLLIPGEGRLLLYVPHGRSLSMRLLGRYSNNSWIPFHLSLFSKRSLRRILLESGFTQVEILTYSPIHSLPFSLRQFLGRAGNRPGWGRLQWPIYLGLMPVGWLADRLGMGEELIAVART
jgi:glycosyltransferase involved in cell wall biosynthesis/SAM-dependent methyltransferase